MDGSKTEAKEIEMHSFQEFERFYFRVEAMLDEYPILWLVGTAILVLLYWNNRRHMKGGDHNG